MRIAPWKVQQGYYGDVLHKNSILAVIYMRCDISVCDKYLLKSYIKLYDMICHVF